MGGTARLVGWVLYTGKRGQKSRHTHTHTHRTTSACRVTMRASLDAIARRGLGGGGHLKGFLHQLVDDVRLLHFTRELPHDGRTLSVVDQRIHRLRVKHVGGNAMPLKEIEEGLSPTKTEEQTYPPDCAEMDKKQYCKSSQTPPSRPSSPALRREESLGGGVCIREARGSIEACKHGVLGAAPSSCLHSFAARPQPSSWTFDLRAASPLS